VLSPTLAAMAPALFDGLYNLAAPREGGAQLCAEMAFDKHELEWLATQEVPGASPLFTCALSDQSCC